MTGLKLAKLGSACGVLMALGLLVMPLSAPAEFKMTEDRVIYTYLEPVMLNEHYGVGAIWTSEDPHQIHLILKRDQANVPSYEDFNEQDERVRFEGDPLRMDFEVSSDSFSMSGSSSVSRCSRQVSMLTPELIELYGNEPKAPLEQATFVQMVSSEPGYLHFHQHGETLLEIKDQQELKQVWGALKQWYEGHPQIAEAYVPYEKRGQEAP